MPRGDRIPAPRSLAQITASLVAEIERLHESTERTRSHMTHRTITMARPFRDAAAEYSRALNVLRSIRRARTLESAKQRAGDYLDEVR